MKRYLIGTAAVLCGVLLAGAAFAGDLKMNGSTTVLPIGQAAAEKFMASNSDVKITVSGGGSGNGIKALIDGTTDIAMASRPMKDKEKSDAEAKGVKPFEIKVAIDALCAMVHPPTPVNDLSLEQLKEIYIGQDRDTGRPFGGEEKAIAVVGTRHQLRNLRHLGGNGHARREGHSQGVRHRFRRCAAPDVAKNPLANGYDGIAYINDSVKALKVGGVKPTRRTPRVAPIPSAAPLPYTNGEPQGAAKAFVDYLLSPRAEDRRAGGLQPPQLENQSASSSPFLTLAPHAVPGGRVFA
jgi:phosphate transport system substrate-binding protein